MPFSFQPGRVLTHSSPNVRLNVVSQPKTGDLLKLS